MGGQRPVQSEPWIMQRAGKQEKDEELFKVVLKELEISELNALHSGPVSGTVGLGMQPRPSSPPTSRFLPREHVEDIR